MARKDDAKDQDHYYAGYYWGNEPYASSELPGRKSDVELQKDALSRLENLGFSQVDVRVTNGAAILTGTVRNNVEKRDAGVEVWKTPGIVKVSNSLQVRAA